MIVRQYVIVTPLDERTPEICRARCGIETDFPHYEIPHRVEEGEECRCIANKRPRARKGQRYDEVDLETDL